MTNRIWACLAVPALLTTFSLPPAAAQSQQDLQAQIEELKEGQEAMAEDVAAIKEMLEGMQPKKPKPFEPMDVMLSGKPYRGNEDAKVTVVEYTDFQCPFCKRHKTNTLTKLMADYVATGKVRYYIGQFPLKSIHPQATKASEAALCANDQGKYWEVHDAIFDNQRKISEADLAGYAEGLGLDVDAFKSCLSSGKYTEKVNADLQEGMKAGIRGTPSFVLGLTDPNDDSKFRATEFIRGAQPYAAFQKALDDLLAGNDQPDEAKTE